MNLPKLYAAKWLIFVKQVSSLDQLNSVIFKDKASAPVARKFFSLFPGLGYAAGYKVGGGDGAYTDNG
jgi:hypothetical protein